GQDEAEIYCQKFRKWSVLTQWNECALAAKFRDGLSEAIKDVMVGFPVPTGLNESMTMAIQIDRRLRERKPVHHLAVSSEQAPEIMQCDRIQSRSERQNYRRKDGLCFYCGDSAHVISACSKRTKKVDKSVAIGTLQSKFILSVTLICSLSSISVDAYVDSGAALSLMDWSFANRCGFSLEPLEVPIPLKGIDSTPLAMNKPQYWTQVTMRMTPVHQEVIRFLVSSPKFKPRFIGPYRILEILNPVSFRLDLPASFAIHNVFHRSLLRKYEWLPHGTTHPPPIALNRRQICSIRPQPLQVDGTDRQGYLDDTGNFRVEEIEEQLESDSEDSVRLDGDLTQIVTVRMRHNTKRKILQLVHENVLQVNEIETDCYKTKLVTHTFNGHVCPFNEAKQDFSVSQLFSFLKQMTLGLQELHRHNIVHCDLRCSHIYINPGKNAVSKHINGKLSGRKRCSVMNRSAPEVRNKGVYSKASDVFNLAAVFWEAISLNLNIIYQNRLIEPFQYCDTHLETYCQSVKNQGQIEDPVHKLLICVQTCWNPNPTKRPTLDKIINVINEIMTPNTQCSATAGALNYDPVPNDDEEMEELYDKEQEEVYDKVINCDSDSDYNWDSVINEIASRFGLPKSRKLFFYVKEQDDYEDVGISRSSKTPSKRGFIL
ncbi:unnamed protein product, partial [Ranitomeya imitator]